MRYLPACDLPNHVALASVLARLLRGGAAAAGVGQHYALHPQPLPYHLVYVLLVLCVSLGGPVLGGKIAMVVLAVATQLAGSRLLALLGAAPVAALALPLAFYSLDFTWGFVATLTGLPCALWALGSLARSRYPEGTPRDLVVAAVAGALAVAAHVLWLVPLACCAALALSPPRLARLWQALLVLAALGAAALRGLPTRSLGDAAAGPYVYFASVQSVIDMRLLGNLGEASMPMVRAWHLRLLLVAAIWALCVRLGRGIAPAASPAARRLARTWLVALVLTSLAMPHTVRLGGAFGEMLDFRYWPVLECLLLATLLPQPAPRPRRFAALCAALVGCAAAFFVALRPAWVAADQDAAAVVDLVARLPAHGSLGVVTTSAPSGNGIWPRIGDHLPSYYVATQGDLADNLFVGGHLPLRARDPWPRLDPDAPPRFGRHDAVCEHHAASIPRGPPPDGVLLGHAPGWTCYVRRPR